MKKLIITCLILITALTSVSASLMPYYDPYFDKDSVFSSPARLIEESKVTPFGVKVEAFSAADYLSYLASPSSALSEASDYLYQVLMNGDLEFWRNNYDAFEQMFSFDNSANLPSQPTDDADLLQIKAYLRDSFQNRFDDTQKASAVLTAMSTTSIFSSSDAPVLNGNANLSLKMYGGVIYDNGFGWQVNSNIGFYGNSNMLSSGTNLLNMDVRGDVGYAFHLFSDRFTIGLSLELGAFMQNSMGNYNLLNARFTGNPVNAFSNPFKLGLGFSTNFGAMYRHNEELAFTLDAVNVASFRKYTDMALTDFMSFDGFDKDSNVYYQPMDLILRALWNRGPYHVVVEIGDVINQVIWMNSYSSYEFDFFSIPKVYFTYDFNSDLSLSTGLEYSKLLLGVEYKGFNAEISASLDKLAFGITAGYEF